MEAKIDRQRLQEFARRLFGHYTSGILTLLVHVGHRTGLFEELAKGPGTSGEIAERAGLNRTYLSDLERGKETEQVRRILRVLKELGVRMTLERADW